ncbi:membrane protein containing DUF81 [Candidatus Magnetoovum chiemensis]|nr:membrane protein containing DUF81 [Candidatus Magnetoovum chiemensis]
MLYTIFPLGILISTIAMMSGIEGSAFWTPALLYLYGLDPHTAIFCGILIEVFGFGSGVIGYAKARKINYKNNAPLILYAAAFGLFGSFISKLIPKTGLLFLIPLSAVYLSIVNIHRAQQTIQQQTSDNPTFSNLTFGKILFSIGGFLSATVGVGIGEVSNYYFLIKNRYSVAYTAGNSVFITAITAFIITLFNIVYYKTMHDTNLYEALKIIAIAVPAVMIGAQLGVIIARKINKNTFHYIISIIFAIIALLGLYKIFL